MVLGLQGVRELIVSLVASFFANVKNHSYIVASFLQSLESQLNYMDAYEFFK